MKLGEDLDLRSPLAPRDAHETVVVREQRSHHTVDRRTLHVRTWSDPSSVDRPDGSSAPVVMVHGLGVASRMCEPTARLLAADRTVHAPDLPGFGRSEPGPKTYGPVEHAEVLARWMDQAALAPSVLVGTSLGAQVVAELALRCADRCAGVVLASPTVESTLRTWPQQLRRWQQEQRTQSWGFRSLMVRDYLHCGPARVVATFDRALRHHVERTVSHIDCPVLVCRGTRDPLVSRSWASELAGRCDRGRLRVLPGATHAMCHDSPLELSRVMAELLHEADGGAHR